MKKIMTSIVMLVFLFSSLAVSQTLETVKQTDNRYQTVVENLLVGLQSENLGLKTSSAHWLGEMKAQKAVIPLMKMFRSDSDIRAQLMAAQSLAKIENEKGVYLVKRTGEFSDNPRMQRICKQLYIGYLNNQIKGTVEVEDIFQVKLEEAEKFIKVALAGK